jgi:hypothetical protein
MLKAGIAKCAKDRVQADFRWKAEKKFSSQSGRPAKSFNYVGGRA